MGVLKEREGSSIKSPVWIIVGRCRRLCRDSVAAKRAVKYINVEHKNRLNRK